MARSARWWREGEFVRNLPPSFQWFGLSQSGGQTLVILAASLAFLAWSPHLSASGSDALSMPWEAIRKPRGSQASARDG